MQHFISPVGTSPVGTSPVGASAPPRRGRCVPGMGAIVGLVSICALASPISASAQTKGTVVASGVPAPTCSGVGPTTVAAIKNGTGKGIAQVYEEPTEQSRRKASVQNGKEVRGRVIFTVIEKQGDWLHVNAPVRPNGTTGWVKASEYTTYTHNWTVLVELGLKRIVVCQDNKVFLSEKVGVGKPGAPTTVGLFYTTELLKPTKRNGPYGPYAYGISGFSDVYQTFGGGDGRIGIHGTNAPDSLGKADTNGCVRMSNVGITKLKAKLPLGVPVLVRQ